ncbi:MAG TPA: twin-arginine translocase TatA/TatE family subunit [Candidatus Baltobacteraceae bacterium]|nr:twin-arginine translocase TatA/TatE family subunit [Candidatus Baltobacteraceae bacterium]
MLGTTEIALIVGAAILLFGVDKLPKLARSAGQAKKEFMVGQAEADLAAERAREEARTRAEMQAANFATTPNPAGAQTAVPDPQTGAPGPTTIAPPHP